MTDAPDPTDVDRRDLPARLWARAHHDAAHAVVGTLLGGQVEGVEIWSRPTVGGRVRITGLDDAAAALDAHALVRRIVYLLAGPLAEHISRGGSAVILNEAGALVATTLMAGLRDPEGTDLAPDLRTVVRLVLDHFGPDDEPGAAAAVDHMALNVEGYVREQWTNIQLVVASLLRQGSITEEQFQSLLTRALPSAPPSGLYEALPARSDPSP